LIKITLVARLQILIFAIMVTEIYLKRLKKMQVSASKITRTPKSVMQKIVLPASKGIKSKKEVSCQF